MNTQVLTDSYNKVLTERNRLLFAFAIATILSLLLGASNFYLIGRERIVVIPPTVSRAFWVASDSVSDSYLQEMSQYFSSLLLNITPNTFAVNSEHLLQNVAPQHFGALKAQLVQQQMEIERRGVSTSFYPASFKIDKQKLLVELKGELKILVGNAPLESKTKTYHIKFVQRHGRLFIQFFHEVENAP
jgi:conjugal transfer pilus assembly protein TraE